MTGDDPSAHTSVSMAAGPVAITIETATGWTPELIEHVLTRCRRQLVATVRQLGLVATPESPADSFPVAPPLPVLPCPALHPHRPNSGCKGDDSPVDFDG